MTQQPLQLPGNTQMLVVCLLAFCFTAVLYPGYIRWLKNKQVEQYLREDGPKSHAHKAKTPTTGGVVFGLVATVLSLFVLLTNPSAAPWEGLILLTAVVCGVIGFIDDYAKFTQRSNKGISGYVRLVSELLLGLCVSLTLVFVGRESILTPIASELARFLSGTAGITVGHMGMWVPPWPFFVLLSTFVIAGAANSVNIHDGMDGLAAGTTCQVFATLAVMLFATGQIPCALIAASVAGGLCGFLIFNKNPAQIFMGDTGSLFIGGLMGSLVVVSGLVFWFVPLALIYISESISVFMQVIYFKLTKHLEGQEKMPLYKVVITKLTKRIPGEGKRIFRMAPLHHHYEAVYADKGVPEWQVVAGFWVVQLLLCLSTLSVFFAFL